MTNQQFIHVICFSNKSYKVLIQDEKVVQCDSSLWNIVHEHLDTWLKSKSWKVNSEVLVTDQGLAMLRPKKQKIEELNHSKNATSNSQCFPG
jgi:hypothetical protein